MEKTTHLDRAIGQRLAALRARSRTAHRNAPEMAVPHGPPPPGDEPVTELASGSEAILPALRHPERWVAGLALAAAATSVAVDRWVFPYGSVNNDEGIYRLQAQTLAHGHFFAPAPVRPAPFTPWLAAVVDHHYAFKYTPVEAALLAASHLLTGSYLPLLGAVAAALVVVTWLLARSALGNPTMGVVAATLVAASPLVVVQSGLLLAYLPTLLVLELASWLLIGAVRSATPRGRARRGMVAGLLLGVAVTVRPYDAVLFAAPLVIWALATGDWRARLRLTGWLAAGGALPAAALGAYDVMATGNVLTLPFNVLERADTIGFGVRRMYPADAGHHFALAQGIQGVGDHLRLLSVWTAGGIVLVALAVLAAFRQRGLSRAVAAIAVTLPAGYLLFWGSWNAADVWGGLDLVGPFYVLPVVVPLSILGAWALFDLRRRPRVLTGTVVAMVSITVLAFVPMIRADARASRQDGEVLRLTRKPTGPALVFVDTLPAFLGHPISGLSNGWRVGGDRVGFAVATGTGADLDALADLPNRPTFLLSLSGAYSPHPRHPGALLRQLDFVRGPTVVLDIEPVSGATIDGLTLDTGGRVGWCGPPGDGGRWLVRLGGDGSVSCDGSTSLPPGAVGSGAAGSLELVTSGPQGTRSKVSLAVSAAGGVVSVLVPGRTVGTTGRPPTPDVSVSGTSGVL